MNYKNIPDSPKERGPEVCRLVVKELLPALLKWEKNVDSDQVEEDVADVLANSTGWDGYELAKDIEHKGWSPDSNLVEILDQADYHQRSAYRKLRLEWVKAYGVVVQAHKGQGVRGRFSGTRVIKTVDHDTAEVHCSDPDKMSSWIVQPIEAVQVQPKPCCSIDKDCARWACICLCHADGTLVYVCQEHVKLSKLDGFTSQVPWDHGIDNAPKL